MCASITQEWRSLRRYRLATKLRKRRKKLLTRAREMCLLTSRKITPRPSTGLAMCFRRYGIAKSLREKMTDADKKQKKNGKILHDCLHFKLDLYTTIKTERVCARLNTNIYTHCVSIASLSPYIDWILLSNFRADLIEPKTYLKI